MLTAECQLERFLLENPPNDKNIDTAAAELPGVQQELLKVAAAHPKVNISYGKFIMADSLTASVGLIKQQL